MLKIPFRSFRQRRTRRGKIVVVLALTFPLIIMLAAYAIGLHYLQLTRMKLQSVVDASALAAADHFSVTNDHASSRESAKRVAAGNVIHSEALQLTDDSIEFGHYARNGDSWDFTADEERPNAVRVTGSVLADSGLGPARLLEWIDQDINVEVTRTSVAMHVDRDIAVVADRSYSMAYETTDILPINPDPILNLLPPNAPIGWAWCLAVPTNSKWRKLMVGTDEFLRELQATPSEEYVSLVSFADDARIDNELTQDFQLLRRLLQLLADQFCGGQANMDDGIQSGIESLAASTRPNSDKIILLLTGSRASLGTPVVAASTAAEAGVTVHVVSFGADIDDTLMSSIAAAGGGRHWHASNVTELQSILRRIARSARVITVQST